MRIVVALIVVLGVVDEAGAAADGRKRFWRELFEPCAGGAITHLSLSGTAVRLGEEGDPLRLAVGKCVHRAGNRRLFVDGVLSYVDAADHGGAGGGVALGVGVDVVLRWDLAVTRLAVYAELGGGLQNTSGSSFPSNGTHANFTVIAGLGLPLSSRARRSVTLGMRYFHVSNANMLPENSGYDAFQVVLGHQWRGQ